MSMRFFGCALVAVGAGVVVAGSAHAQLINSEWNADSGNWNVAANWAPADIPNDGGGLTFDVEIGNRPVAAGAVVTFIPEDGNVDGVTDLTITNGADLDTNGFTLLVDDQTTISGVGSSLIIDPRTTPVASFDSDNLLVTGGGSVLMNGGILNVDDLLQIDAGASLAGFGTVHLGLTDGASQVILENPGTILVSRPAIGGGPLVLETDGIDRIDIDGNLDTGVLDVSNAPALLFADSLVLVVDAPLADEFGGTLQIGQRDTATFNVGFEMSAAVVEMDGGNNTATLTGAGEIFSIGGSDFTITGNALITNDMTFLGETNSVVVNASSTLRLNGTVLFNDASTINLNAAGTELVIGGTTTISDALGDFNWDGGGATTTLANGGFLDLAVDQIDLGNNEFDGTINFDGAAALRVNVTATTWTMDGTLNKNDAGFSTIDGDAMIVTGAVNVNASTLIVNSFLSMGNGGALNVAPGALAVTGAATLGPGSTLDIDGFLELGQTTNLAGPASIGGDGRLRLTADSAVTANTTVDVASFDWDGQSPDSDHVINNGVALVINSPVLGQDGAIDDRINLGGNGARIDVNGPASWEMRNRLSTNPTDVGEAVIGGTSRMVLTSVDGVLNVDGNTTIVAPVTFGIVSTVDIDTVAVLNLNNEAIYNRTVITGAGSFNPNFTASGNTVVDDTVIEVDRINFDRGDWRIEPDATLFFDAIDYDFDTPAKDFTATMTIDSGTMDLELAGPAEFVMNGVLNMNNSAGVPLWRGGPLDIGNDLAMLDADLNASGMGDVRIDSQLDFNSDADVEIAAGTRLILTDTVNFNTVNGVNSAEFTGEGAMHFNGDVNVNEAATLDMKDGVVDLDGADDIGDNTGNPILLEAPLIINAATMASFGKTNSGGGVNLLAIDNFNSGNFGVLTVNLDNPEDEWTLNAEGAMNLANDDLPAILLDGADVNINGDINVLGDVVIAARMDIGATSVITITTAGQPLRIGGGNTTDPNTIAGGVITGPGPLGANDGTALHGFGTINTTISFIGDDATLKADDGVLAINGFVGLVEVLGTADDDGILDIANPWNTNVTAIVQLNGGELRGAAITNNGPGGIQGSGFVSAKVINNTHIDAVDGTLVVATSLNDNDWDGAANTGALNAINSDLEIRDNAQFLFQGTVSAEAGQAVFANGFELDFEPGSTLRLDDGASYRSTNATDIGGAMIVEAGTARLQIDGRVNLEATSATALDGNLELDNPETFVRAGATFTGSGDLVNLNGRELTLVDGADVGVLVENQGGLEIHGERAGSVQVEAFRQTAAGQLNIDLGGTEPIEFDQMSIGGRALIDGTLDVSLIEGFVPQLNDAFKILSSGEEIGGTFAAVNAPPLDPGLALRVIYDVSAVVLEFGLAGDFGMDGTVDAGDYTIWRDAFGAEVAPYTGADVTGDGIVDNDDYDVWKASFGNSSPGSGAGARALATVPEPAVVVLLLQLAGAALCRLRARRK